MPLSKSQRFKSFLMSDYIRKGVCVGGGNPCARIRIYTIEVCCFLPKEVR